MVGKPENDTSRHEFRHKVSRDHPSTIMGAIKSMFYMSSTNQSFVEHIISRTIHQERYFLTSGHLINDSGDVRVYS